MVVIVVVLKFILILLGCIEEVVCRWFIECFGDKRKFVVFIRIYYFLLLNRD